jgi:hypothetical protein
VSTWLVTGVLDDISDGAVVERLLREHRPDAVVNFAAESNWTVRWIDAAQLRACCTPPRPAQSHGMVCRSHLRRSTGVLSGL